MAIPKAWLERSESEIDKLLSDYPSLANRGNAFAVWAVQQLHDLSEEESLESVARVTRGPGDGGIDAVVNDDLSQVLYLIQCKYADDFQGSFDEEAAAQLFGALDLLMDPRYVSQSSSEFRLLHDRVSATLAGGSELILQVVLAGEMSAEAQSRVAAYVDALHYDQVRVEVITVNDFWRSHEEESQGLDLKGEWVELEIVGSPLAVPTRAEGLVEASVVFLDAISLIPVVEKFGRRLVANNLRHLLKRTKINDAIAASTQSEISKGKFALLNNGLTITCELAEASANKIRLLNPQVVNGGQTTMTLFRNRHNFGAGEIYLMGRIVATDQGAPGRALALEIAESTNRQNPITPADLKANDDRQRELQSELAALVPPWFYERRRNERASMPPGSLSRFAGVITKEDLGQRWRAFNGAPAAAIRNKQLMFEQQDLYGEIYDGRNDARLYVLAHELFSFYFEFLGSSARSQRMRELYIPAFEESDRADLIRARNQWAAHCSAVTASLLQDGGDHVPLALGNRVLRELLDGLLEDARGEFAPVVRLALVTVHSWFRAKKREAQAHDEILAVKAEFEKVSTFAELIDQSEAYRALLANMAAFEMTDTTP